MNIDLTEEEREWLERILTRAIELDEEMLKIGNLSALVANTIKAKELLDKLKRKPSGYSSNA
jgi:hypothetical protein